MTERKHVIGLILPDVTTSPRVLLSLVFSAVSDAERYLGRNGITSSSMNTLDAWARSWGDEFPDDAVVRDRVVRNYFQYHSADHVFHGLAHGDSSDMAV
jgi:hypothetical protein